MRNKTLNIGRLKDKLFQYGLMDQFEEAWRQMKERGWYAIPGNGGWIIISAM